MNLRPYQPGENHHTRRRAFQTAKLEALRREYDPDGRLSAVNVDRLLLAAKHFAIAQTTDDPTVSTRSVRVAEYLLSKIARPETPIPDLAELGL
jgi:hypothetical protein